MLAVVHIYAAFKSETILLIIKNLYFFSQLYFSIQPTYTYTVEPFFKEIETICPYHCICIFVQ